MQKVVQIVLFTALMLLSFISHVAAADVSYEKIYKKQCATCHGNKGDGKGRAAASFSSTPTDFTSPQSRTSLTAERIKAAIRDGVAGTSMVAYGRRFDDAALAGLTDFIQATFMQRVSNRMSNSAKAQSSDDRILGEGIYNDNCSACHGDKGQSAVWAKNGLNPPPRNFTTAQASEELSRERMITSVTYGRPGTAMMPFAKRLSSDEIEAVVGYIRLAFMKKPALRSSPSLSHGAASPVASLAMPLASSVTAQSHDINVDMRVSFPEDLKGHPLKGKQFYNENCFTCHGKQGDGKGPRSHFNYPRPRNFTSQDSRLIFNRTRLFQSISRGKRGSVMPAWNAVLTQQQIADVAEYVFQQFILNKNVAALKKKL